jgi:hypothetical protein
LLQTASQRRRFAKQKQIEVVLHIKKALPTQARLLLGFFLDWFKGIA